MKHMTQLLAVLVCAVGLSACTGSGDGADLSGDLWCFDGYAIKQLTGSERGGFVVAGTLSGGGEVTDFAISRDGHAWLSTSSGRLFRYSTRNGALAATVDVGGDVKYLAALGSHVYAHSENRGLTLSRIDVATNTASALTWGERNYDADRVKLDPMGRAYALSGNAFELLRVGPTSLSSPQIQEIQSGFSYGDFTIAGSSIWVVSGYNQILSRLSLADLSLDRDFQFELPFDLDNQVWLEANENRLAIVSRDSKRLFTVPQSVAAESEFTETDLGELSPTDVVGDGENIAIAARGQRELALYSISDGARIGSINTEVEVSGSTLPFPAIGATYCDFAD